MNGPVGILLFWLAFQEEQESRKWLRVMTQSPISQFIHGGGKNYMTLEIEHQPEFSFQIDPPEDPRVDLELSRPEWSVSFQEPPLRYVAGFCGNDSKPWTQVDQRYAIINLRRGGSVKVDRETGAVTFSEKQYPEVGCP